ncbi:MAG: methyltransferase, partial [Oscillochloris sp.]|nr:methyltransferase [Oscillochloris sp.]
MFSQDDTQHLAQITLAGEPIRYVAPPGLPAVGGGDAAMALCARLVVPGESDRILLLGCGHGALGVALARAARCGRVILHDPNLIALGAARQSLALNHAANADISAEVTHLPGLVGQFDRVVVLGPQSRALARRWLLEALALLRPGGTLNLAGANQTGVQSLIADAAALFGATATLGVGKGCRVAQAIRPPDPPAPPAWAGQAGVALGSWHRVQAQLPTGCYELYSLPGVFSSQHLDVGTALLLASLPLPAGA